MNIVFLEAVQNFGGARKSTIELAKRLKEQENNVLIIDFWGSCKPFIDKVSEFNISIDFLDKSDDPFLLYDRNKLKMLFNYFIYFFRWFNYRSILRSKINDFHADIIIVNNAKTLSILSKSSKYKIAYFARGWFLPSTIPFFNKLLIKKLVDIFVAVSQSTRQAIFAGGYAKLENIYVVPNAIDQNEKMQDIVNVKNNLWYKSNNERPFVLLHSGGFLPTKGQHIVVEIAQRLKEENVNFKIFMTGLIYKGEQSRKFYDEVLFSIKKYNLSNFIEVVVNKSDVDEYFYLSDVLIHPSETEGLPRVVMEAMAFGKPVIGNPVGGMTDYILHQYTGYIAHHNNIDDYLNAIKELIFDKEKYKFISENAISLISSVYTNKNQLTSFSKILHDLKNESV